MSITQADNECRLEGDKTHEIFHFLSKKVGGGHFLCGPHQAEKWGGGDASPPVPHRSTPVALSEQTNGDCVYILFVAKSSLRNRERSN